MKQRRRPRIKKQKDFPITCCAENEAKKKAENKEEETDVNPHLLFVGMPQKLTQDVQVNEDLARLADQDLQPEQPTESPRRTTRQTTRETGVPVPQFQNVQPSFLERSIRNRADATEMLNQFRRETNDAVRRTRPENQQDGRVRP